MEEHELRKRPGEERGAPRRRERDEAERAEVEAGPSRTMTDLRGAVRSKLAGRPYLVLGGLCTLGLAIGLRMPRAGKLARVAMRSGLDSLLAEVLG